MGLTLGCGFPPVCQIIILSFRSGLNPGDVILSINDKVIMDTSGMLVKLYVIFDIASAWYTSGTETFFLLQNTKGMHHHKVVKLLESLKGFKNVFKAFSLCIKTNIFFC